MGKTKLFIGSGVIVGFFVLASLAFAQSPSKADRMERSQNACEKVTAALNGRVTSANARISARESFATKMKDQVQKHIQQVQSKGADVTKLQSDATALTTLLDKWLVDYKTYVADLQAAQKLNCGTSQGQFKTALQTAKTAHKMVKQDRDAIKDFFKNTLKPDFKKARQSVQPTVKPS